MKKLSREYLEKATTRSFSQQNLAFSMIESQSFLWLQLQISRKPSALLPWELTRPDYIPYFMQEFKTKL